MKNLILILLLVGFISCEVVVVPKTPAKPTPIRAKITGETTKYDIYDTPILEFTYENHIYLLISHNEQLGISHVGHCPCYKELRRGLGIIPTPSIEKIDSIITPTIRVVNGDTIKTY